MVQEKIMQQKGLVIWITGLPCSGKTSLGKGLEATLTQQGYVSCLLDGDEIRKGINRDLGFSEEDRKENIRRVAEISRLLVNRGVISINCFVSPAIEMRVMARDIIGKEHFVEIFLSTPVEVCKRRDLKGMYKEAERGEIKNFTGINAPYEKPKNPDIMINTEILTVPESVNKVMDFVIPRISSAKR